MEMLLAGARCEVPSPAHEVPLSSRLSSGDLAWNSVTAACIAARPTHSPDALPDPDRIAMSYRSDQFFRLDGEAQSAWSPYSRFWRASDGWVRTHGNYPHHARAFRQALELTSDVTSEQAESAIAQATMCEVVARVVRAGGLAVPIRREEPQDDAALRSTPLVDISDRGGDGGSRDHAEPDATAPLAGIRVLDLTRVIAGPVCTRTLALLGADVLRVDPPGLAEIAWQHLDTGHGKRSSRLDAASPQMSRLLGRADVVVLGYRPAALNRLGLSVEALAETHPGLIIAQLSAWGAEHPDRAGFDSLVQAESGIALIESVDDQTPGALPAQALDHSAGYLLAAGICIALARRRVSGGTLHVSTSLRRVAAELLGMPRRADLSTEAPIDSAPHLQDFAVGAHTVTTVRSALPDFSFEAPRMWGSDVAEW